MDMCAILVFRIAGCGANCGEAAAVVGCDDVEIDGAVAPEVGTDDTTVGIAVETCIVEG